MPELPAGAPPTPITLLGDVAKWEFRISCGRCRRKVMVRAATVIEREGPHVPVYRIVDRFRCDGWGPSGRCGGRPRSVLLAEIWYHGKSGPIVRQLEVFPNG